MPSRDIIGMARTNAKKREAELLAGAGRQARRRARMAEARRPDTQACDRAIVEAVSFKFAEVLRDIRAMTDGDMDERARLMKGATVNVSTMVAVACQILVERYGYDRQQTMEAVKLRVAEREQHLDPSFIPSFNPDVAAQAARTAEVAAARASVSQPDGSISDRA
jgi:hypothetical protein